MSINRNIYKEKQREVTGCVRVLLYRCKLDLEDQYTCDYYQRHPILAGCKFQNMLECSSKEAREKADSKDHEMNLRSRKDVEYK